MKAKESSDMEVITQSKPDIAKEGKRFLKFILSELKPKGKLLTPFNIFAAIVIGVGVVLIAVRFIFGLASVTDLSQEFPWGIWIGFDVITGVAFAGGAYVLTFMVYILRLEKYHPIIRITVLNGFLAYVFYGILFNLSIWFKLSHKTQYAIIITAIGAVITIFINVKYIPVYSYHASAVAHVLSYFTMVLISFFLGRKYYRIPYDLKRVGMYFLLGFVLFFTDKYLKLHNIALIFLVKTLLVMIFAIFVAWKENLLKILFKNT